MDIVGIGLCTFDILIHSSELPNWDRPIRLEDIAFDGGGPCSTALCAASKLGAKTGLISTAGNDWFAEQKLKSLTDFGVDISHMLHRDRKENQVVCVNVDSKSGHRIFNTRADFYDAPVTPEDLDRDFITQAEILLLDGHYLEASITAARWMQDAGKSVMLDGGATTAPYLSREKAELVRLTDVLICSDGFAQALTGESNLYAAGKAALAFGPKIVVITQGENGSDCFTTDGTFHTSAFEVEVVDTTGAGDVFHGAFLVGMLRGWDLKRTSVFASAVSAIECTFLGGQSGIPSFDQVRDFLDQRGIDT